MEPRPFSRHLASRAPNPHELSQRRGCPPGNVLISAGSLGGRRGRASWVPPSDATPCPWRPAMIIDELLADSGEELRVHRKRRPRECLYMQPVEECADGALLTYSSVRSGTSNSTTSDTVMCLSTTHRLRAAPWGECGDVCERGASGGQPISEDPRMPRRARRPCRCLVQAGRRARTGR